MMDNRASIHPMIRGEGGETRRTRRVEKKIGRVVTVNEKINEPGQQLRLAHLPPIQWPSVVII